MRVIDFFMCFTLLKKFVAERYYERAGRICAGTLNILVPLLHTYLI